MIVEALDESVIVGLSPGTHLVLLTDQPEAGLEGRRLGLELRDTFLILSPRVTQFGFLFRKAVEGTIAENVLKYSHGALNIDACRVSGMPRDPGLVNPTERSDGWGMQRPGLVGKETPTGRWPPNLVFVHGPRCVQEGTRTSVSPSGTRTTAFGVINDDGWKPQIQKVTRPWIGEDGLETIPAWACQPECPVAALDEQSGELRAGWFSGAKAKGLGYMGASNQEADGSIPITSTGDQGGASRFFPQFKNETELHAWFETLLGPPVRES